MRHPATQALYAYWNEVRAGRLAPRRLEIQPARIGDLLLDTFILEREGPLDFRFRLAGTRVAARFGMNIRARDFLACWREADRSLLAPHLAAIVDLGRVGVFTGETRMAAAPGAPAGSLPFELLVLPLVHVGQAVDRLLCLMVPLAEEPQRPEAGTRFDDLRLSAAEAVWPSGERRDPLAFADRQRPLDPHVRMARIVRQGRRQFRVYEGGLLAAGPDKADGL